ncbi:MAG: DUF3996 domain-containing protein [Ignavibacteria bacterium]|nr:DUF3996 domain-containing protein [Ignavibacteria bacterium]
MKKLYVLLIFLISVSLSAQDKGFGIGIMAGEPTGLSLKAWISGNNAVDAGLAWSFVNKGSLHIHADYLYHFDFISLSSGRMPFYTGIGGRIKLKNTGKGVTDDRFGVRIPFGLDYMFASVPVDIFLELAPVLDLSPKTDLSFNGAIGFRYFIK